MIEAYSPGFCTKKANIGNNIWTNEDKCRKINGNGSICNHRDI